MDPAWRRVDHAVDAGDGAGDGLLRAAHAREEVLYYLNRQLEPLNQVDARDSRRADRGHSVEQGLLVAVGQLLDPRAVRLAERRDLGTRLLRGS